MTQVSQDGAWTRVAAMEVETVIRISNGFTAEDKVRR